MFELVNVKGTMFDSLIFWTRGELITVYYCNYIVVYFCLILTLEWRIG